jgi:hypothetical protein
MVVPTMGTPSPVLEQPERDSVLLWNDWPFRAVGQMRITTNQLHDSPWRNPRLQRRRCPARPVPWLAAACVPTAKVSCAKEKARTRQCLNAPGARIELEAKRTLLPSRHAAHDLIAHCACNVVLHKPARLSLWGRGGMALDVETWRTEAISV